MPIDPRPAAWLAGALLLGMAAPGAEAEISRYKLRIPASEEFRLRDDAAWRLPPPITCNLKMAKRPYAGAVGSAAGAAGIETALLHAVVKVESGYDPAALSPKGAQGLAQLLPATAQRFGTTANPPPAANLAAGARYLRWLLDRFGQRLPLALAAYNAGEGAVDRHGGIPPYPETQAYVARVLAEYAALRSAEIADPSPWQLQPEAKDGRCPKGKPG